MSTSILQDSCTGSNDTDELQSRLTYVYLCSPPHSGSTLFACIAAAHPEVSTVGELASTFPAGAKCSCGTAYKDCDFWQQWARRAEAEGIEFRIGDLGINLEPYSDGWFSQRLYDDSIRAAPSRFQRIEQSLFFHEFPHRSVNRLRDVLFSVRPAIRKHTQQVIEKNVRLARMLTNWEKTRVLLDTTKNPFQVRFLEQHPEIDLKVICLHRDGRGVVNSLMRHYGQSPRQAIGNWMWNVRNIDRVINNYVRPQQVLSLKLEDLCDDTPAVCRRLFAFLGVDQHAPLDLSEASGCHLIGNRMRLSFDGTIRQDERWKTEMNSEAETLFERLAGRTNQHLGYRN